ncbi:glycosyltransferase family 2 protein [bacterium]|nr:MAG: glycosyltransferase family 2 protein [bacterium]
MKSNPKVSIIIVNYNGFEETINCLKSLAKLNYPNFNVIIIENGSANNSFEKIKNFLKHLMLDNKHPIVRLIESKENLGFAGGCNLGIRKAKELGSNYFLLLNPDTTVKPDFLRELIEVAVKPENYKAIKAEIKNEKKLGFLGPRIFYEDKKTIYSNGGFINKNLTSATLKDHGKTKKGLNNNDPFTTDYITGTALLLSEKVLDDIGYMDEDYFLYYEDSDWAVKAREKKYFHAIVPSAIIYHKGYHSTEYLSFNYIYYLMRNGYFLAWKNGNLQQKILVVFYSVYKLTKQPFKIFLPKKRKWVKPLIKATWDFWRGRYGEIKMTKSKCQKIIF